MYYKQKKQGYIFQIHYQDFNTTKYMGVEHLNLENEDLIKLQYHKTLFTDGILLQKSSLFMKKSSM